MRRLSPPEPGDQSVVTAVLTLVVVIPAVFVIVLEALERPDDVVAHQALVRAVLGGRGGIDERATAPEPATQVQTHRQLRRRPCGHHDRGVEPELLFHVQVARVGEVGAVERPVHADTNPGEVRMRREKRVIRCVAVVRRLVNLKLQLVKRPGGDGGLEHALDAVATVDTMVWLDSSQSERSTGFSSTLRSTSSTLEMATVLLLASVKVSGPPAWSEADRPGAATVDGLVDGCTVDKARLTLPAPRGPAP